QQEVLYPLNCHCFTILHQQCIEHVETDNYTYIHTNQSKTETIYAKLENCTTIETG
ncbi:unnamed protein product, partial [Tenebrio molitor]